MESTFIFKVDLNEVRKEFYPQAPNFGLNKILKNVFKFKLYWNAYFYLIKALVFLYRTLNYLL